MLADLDTRTVLRVTLIKDWNDSEEMISGFKSIFEKSNAHFYRIEILHAYWTFNKSFRV